MSSWQETARMLARYGLYRLYDAADRIAIDVCVRASRRELDTIRTPADLTRKANT